MITSSSNGQIRHVMQLLRRSRYREEQKQFVVEGIRMFREIPPKLLVQAYVSETFAEENDWEHLCPNAEVVKDSVMVQMSDTKTPQGILGVVRQQEYSLEELLAVPQVNLILLEDVRDPGNLGTIIRCSEGAGVHGILASRESVDLYNPKVVRATMGSVFRMPVLYTEDWDGLLTRLKQEGIVLYAAHLQGRKDYDEEDYTGRIGVIIGNEARGITDRTAAAADRLVKIPMEGKVESLNAAVAASVFMYEAYRQRRQKKRASGQTG